MTRIRVLAGLLAAMLAGTAMAAPPATLLPPLESQARQDDPAFAGFSAERGGRFFADKHGGKWSCASCHTPDPRNDGRHAATGRPIAALAPSANPQRLTDPAKVDKWFRRNCRDVVARECSAAEKGDVITYLLSLQ
ncbi:DUF1924 domain-containing protein [Sinimarinibacterium sp. CAU 1509]|uniref:DUF1924 domain-containing protein n=1 Tax=Sinimarinibacterium sp. CAU 1509 TaxID=2562283 RepID=UPI0010AD43C6|nr:DUF1924 domain-containing protein [Sinimarinibacterium sp. CAU 1509]TJY64949.1 DUF1924 domain-containing protein [Sinimarinibacterium sp. CAU 1509]